MCLPHIRHHACERCGKQHDTLTQDVCVLILKTYEYVTSCGKRDFVDVIKQRTLREIALHCLGRSSSGRGKQRRQSDVM